MKKNIQKMSLAAIAAMTMVSCSNHDAWVTYEQAKAAEYEAAFVKKYGNIDPNQTWGFGLVSGLTTKSAAEFGWEISSDYEAKFSREYYDFVFEKLPESVNATTQLTNYEFVSKGPFQFSIIYSQTSASDKVGYYYYDPKTETIDDRQEVVFVENIQNLGDYVQVRWSNDSYFKNMSTYDGENMWNGNWGDTVAEAQAKVFTVNVPAGYRVGFFIVNGDFTGYSNSDLNNETNGKKNYYSAVVEKDGDAYLVGLEDWNNSANNSDLDCNDVIMAVSAIDGGELPTPVDPDEVPEVDPDEPGEGGETEDKVVSESGRIFCEDLGSIGDFDFNDVVFDAWVYTDGSVKIQVLAAGGTLPISVAGVDVHSEIFGGVNMVNTGVNKADAVNDGIIELTAAEAEALEIDNLNSIPVVVKQTNPAGYEEKILLQSKQGDAPQKICAPLGTKWMKEYKPISDGYPNFEKWVGNSKLEGDDVFTGGVDDLLY